MFDVVVLIGHFLIFCFVFAAAARFGMWDGRVVVGVRSGRYAKRQGLPFVVEEEYYYLSCKVDFGIVGEGGRVD